MLAAGLSVVVLAACGKNGASPNRAMNDDLKRDLQAVSSSGLDLASQQASKGFALTEIAQSSAPAPANTLKKSAGPKAVRSKTPTVKAAPDNSIDAKAAEPTVEVATQAPSPTTEPAPTPDPAPAVPRPSSTPTDPNGGEGAHGRNGGGSNPGDGGGGIGSVIGGIFGAILRGGVVDGDHCDPRTDGRHPRRHGGYYPPPSYPPQNGIPQRVGGGVRF